MSAATTAAQHGVERRRAPRGVTFGRVVGAEWTKLTSLRSTWWAATATVAVSGALTWLSANASSVDPGFVPLDSLTAGLVLAQVGPLVLGVLVGTGEFSTGTFRSTFATVPRRLPVLAAQTAVTAGFGLLVAVLAVAAAVLGVLPAARSRDVAVDLAGDGTPHVLVGTAAFLTGMALLGLAIGALVRRTVPAIVTGVVLVLVLPVALTLATEVAADPTAASAGPSAQEAAVNTAVTFLPGGAGALLMAAPGTRGIDGAPDLGPWGGGLVLAAWVLVPLVAAAARLRGRDVT